MENDTSFLKYLIDEEIYVINDADRKKSEGENLNSHDEQIQLYTNANVILLDFPEEESLSLQYQDFLSKILKSIGLNPSNVEKIFSEDLKNLSRHNFEDSTVIAFIKQIPDNLSDILDSERYSIKTSGNNKFILCDSLEVIDEDTTLKRYLWDQLKVLYQI